MRYWEFLIQQEGDQTWLPLETRQVEILEGRYRMAAHTSYDEAPVEVRLSQLLLDEMPPRRRVRKRKAITNDSGLLAIFPYIQLSPGRWEVHCSSPDVIDDFLGESWEYSIQLEVTPRDEDDWGPEDWATPHAEESEPPTAISHGEDGQAPQANGAGEHKIGLQLRQQAYVTQPGQTLGLAGKVTQGPTPLQGDLWVELRDPQTASTLEEMAFDLPQQSAPFAVNVAVPEQLSTQVILGAISVRNQAGESVESASFTITIGLAQMLDAIANQPDLEFEEEISIFPGTTESLVPSLEKSATLLDNETPLIPKEIIPSEGLTLPPQIKPPSGDDADADREPELPEFPAESQTPPPAQNAPAAAPPRQPEPATVTPQPTRASDFLDSELEDHLNPPIKDDLNGQIEDTPNVQIEDHIDGRLDDDELPSNVIAFPEADSADAVDDDDRPELTQAERRVWEEAPFAKPRVFERRSIRDDDLDGELANAALNDRLDTGLFDPPDPTEEFLAPSDIGYDNGADYREDDELDETDQAYQQLKLQERFWQKLNLLTQDGYRQSLEVKKALNFSADNLSTGNPQSDEFVVYDAPDRWTPKQQPAPTENPNAPSRSKGLLSQQTNEEPVQVAAPSLEVPEQDLIAGEWVAVRVRLPMSNGDSRAYVKVWMNDLQTRTLIDAPRLLMQFTPNDHNELETLMRVKLPTGCLELQFAAIAIDMSTLQESRKVVQNRRVMPPVEHSSIFDDLNF